MKEIAVDEPLRLIVLVANSSKHYVCEGDEQLHPASPPSKEIKLMNLSHITTNGPASPFSSELVSKCWVLTAACKMR